ncbi:MAG TPA: FUSC family protein, partial [Geobacteraceae bacterium]|nr:FUSC family protein [Geobacteraceae bacterium]
KADSPATPALAALSESLADVLVKEGEPARTADEALQTERRIAALRAAFPQQVEIVRQKYVSFSGSQANLDCETAVELLYRFVRELHDYTGAYASLIAERQSKRPLDDIRFALQTDPTVAILTGARAMIIVLLVAAFWIASAWPNGASAVMMAAIGSALFASAPDPALAIKMGLIGVLAGFIVSFLCKFFVLTSLDGFGLLCAGMVPFMLVGPYLSLNPKLATMGLGYSTMFCFMISPANSMQYYPVSFINFGTALVIGLAAAAVIFGTFAPVTGAWFKRRTAHMLRRQVEMACFEPLPGLAHRFESGIRDILHRVAAKQELQDPHVRNILDWMFIVLEMGRAIIHLRQDADSIPLSQPLLDSVNKCICSIADLFKQPNAQHYTAAVESVDSSINVILRESGQEELDRNSRDAMRRMLISLHLIRASLMDDETVLAATVTGSQATLQGGTLYAA